MDSVVWVVALGAIAAGFVQGLVPTLLGGKLYSGISEAEVSADCVGDADAVERSDVGGVCRRCWAPGGGVALTY